MKVIVVTPYDADGTLAVELLAGERIAAECVTSLRSFTSLDDELIGCVLLVEEALTQAELPLFQHAIEAQPPWSDLPLLLIAGQETSLGGLVDRLFPHSGNVAVLQRPLHPVGLSSAVTVALRARARQLQVRDLLAQRAQALHRRDEFLAMLAHELRNPLAPIRNAVHMLGMLAINDPVFQKSRAMIDKQSLHITRLVDDLLDVSRLELGKLDLHLADVDLNACVTAAVEAAESITAARGHEVEMQLDEEPLPLLADPVRIEQVLQNLLTNAAKFTARGGRITVGTARNRDHAMAWVEDNGIGIRRENLTSVFDPFVQEDQSLARTPGGLGIGLTLVKRLVDAHGGTVALASGGPGEGTRVEVSFPLAPSHSTH